jgi:hypothetical protein
MDGFNIDSSSLALLPVQVEQCKKEAAQLELLIDEEAKVEQELAQEIERVKAQISNAEAELSRLILDTADLELQANDLLAIQSCRQGKLSHAPSKDEVCSTFSLVNALMVLITNSQNIGVAPRLEVIGWKQ